MPAYNLLPMVMGGMILCTGCVIVEGIVAVMNKQNVSSSGSCSVFRSYCFVTFVDSTLRRCYEYKSKTTHRLQWNVAKGVWPDNSKPGVRPETDDSLR